MGIVYLSNDTGTPVLSGGVIPMTTIRRRKNSCIDTSMAIRSGWYEVTADATLASTVGGLATITLYQDGVAVEASATTIPAGGEVTIPLSSVVRACCGGSVLTLVYTGPVLTGTTASVVIENV